MDDTELRKFAYIIALGGSSPDKKAAEIMLLCKTYAEQQVADIDPEPEETPVLVGHLNREYGYNGFAPIKEGFPVYRLADKYYFHMTSLNTGERVKQSFYMEDLEPDIDFIKSQDPKSKSQVPSEEEEQEQGFWLPASDYQVIIK